MTERWKTWKTNPRFSTFPTAPACTGRKSEKPKDRFPTFPPGARDDDDRPICELKDQRKEVGRYATSSFSCPDFMLIFQLENAKRIVQYKMSMKQAKSGGAVSNAR